MGCTVTWLTPSENSKRKHFIRWGGGAVMCVLASVWWGANTTQRLILMRHFIKKKKKFWIYQSGCLKLENSWISSVTSMMLFGGFFLTPLFGHFFPFSSLNSWFGGNLIYHLPQSVHVCESFRKGEGEGNRDRKGEQHTHTHTHIFTHYFSL